MADVTPTAIAKNTSAVQTLVAVNSADAIVGATQNDVLIVANGAGAPINVTFTKQIPNDEGGLSDLVIAVANGVTRIFPMPIPLDRYKDVNGKVIVNYSSTTTITAGVFRLPA